MYEPNIFGPRRWAFIFTIDNRGKIRLCMDTAVMNTAIVNGKMKFAHRQALSCMKSAPSSQSVILNVLEGAQELCYVGMMLMKTSVVGSTYINEEQTNLLKNFIDVIPAMEKLISARLEDDKAETAIWTEAVEKVLGAVGTYAGPYEKVVETAGEFILDSVTKLMRQANVKVCIESFPNIASPNSSLVGNPFMKKGIIAKGPRVGSVDAEEVVTESSSV